MKEAFNFLTNQEPIFKTIVDQYGHPTIPSRPQGFETLVLLILEQQVSIDSAKATYLRLREKAIAFTPEKLVAFSEEDFRSVGVSRQKATYIKGLSQSIINNEIFLDGLPQKTTVEVREELIKIKRNRALDHRYLFDVCFTCVRYYSHRRYCGGQYNKGIV